MAYTPTPESIGNDPTNKRVTIVSIDGNSVAALSAEMAGEKLRLYGHQHHECEDLEERVDRVRHPVFMDVSVMSIPHADRLAEKLKAVLATPEFAGPVVLLLNSDRLQLHELKGEAGANAMNLRRTDLLRRHLPRNPRAYPCYFYVQEIALSDGESLTRLGLGRFDDLVGLADLLAKVGSEYLGAVPAMYAADHLARHCATGGNTAKPFAACFLGKLRTLYTMLDANGRIAFQTIPVGLCRDEVDYFQTFVPTIKRLDELRRSVGPLLLPPETTPSPLFSGWSSTPQLECTRFASQAARYADRALRATLHGDAELPLHIAGLGRHLPGLREYMQARLQRPTRLLSNCAADLLDHAEHATDVINDQALLLGAAFEVLQPTAASLGPIGGHQHRNGNQKTPRSLSDMETNMVYVLEQPPGSGRS